MHLRVPRDLIALRFHDKIARSLLMQIKKKLSDITSYELRAEVFITLSGYCKCLIKFVHFYNSVLQTISAGDTV